MKETNLETIKDVAVYIIIDIHPLALNYMSIDKLAQILTNAYVSNDTSKVVTDHVDNSMTVIYTRRNVSVIFEDNATRCRTGLPLCRYYDLEEDIINLLSCLDFCIERIEERI